jgi:glycosyltransferase involved in cell wall biosynthesis
MLQSIAQQYHNSTLHCTSDDSTDIARRCAQKNPGRVLYFDHYQYRNRGVCCSRNLGVKHATGEQRPYQLYEDQAFLVKVYLTSSVFAAQECWTRYRMYPNSCMSRFLQDDKKHAAARLFFCDWFEKYLAERGNRERRHFVGYRWIAAAAPGIAGIIDAAQAS